MLAKGYPTPLQPRPDGPPYTENSGLVTLHESPPQSDLDISYTAEVDKGISGRGVLDGVELIGIDGPHTNPLWPGQWNGLDGKAVNYVMQQKLELGLHGIYAIEIVKLRKAVAAPASEVQPNSVHMMSCNANR